MNTDALSLSRFIEAQEASYATALAELRAGRKQTHWIWFVFPQLKGLGSSANADYYGLSGLAEARAYLAHPLLGQRLHEATAVMLAHQAAGAASVLGELDAMKFRSCMTLFARADLAGPVFGAALKRFFAGQPDARTLRLLGEAEE
ncbi:MAG TPA: DUF1810 domain-containing protein [Pseudomonas sp.]|uniref:DUF1810 domain-containing protein n=1 Tax=Pseudomonas sp. TaxID=306 RepID=UPI002CB753DB|nr:DUF1810 domain-containing protein [Pseudomonas sp.]HTO20671.1 DUF1810 domain-containing protein [Pseudomonas sp.]HUH37298.1 DUF1810 domain-containing protein [Spongiibacteraceae bacterium]